MADFRRARGTRVDPASVGWTIERANREQFTAWAHQVGISAAGLLDYLVEHSNAENDPDGLPSWMPDELKDKEQLPIE